MLEALISLDQQVFHFINTGLANPVTDFIMPILTSDWNLRIAYAAIMLLILWNGNKERRWLVVFSIAALVVTDLVSSSLIKPLVARPRPCHVLTDIHLLVNCGAGFSMPSSHAANSFGQALFWGMAYRPLRWYLFVVAFLIAISRAFVGVHYPGDILAGTIVGGLLGYAVYLAAARLVIKKPMATQV
jgi:membrane-associated phospholipid phosphatase